MKLVAVAVLCLALATSGCASVGTNYDENALATLKPGTTRSSVIAALGKPNSITTMADGKQLLLWMHTKSNGLTGHAESRNVALLFDADGKLIRQISQGQTALDF